jgi:hypothetical protein
MLLELRIHLDYPAKAGNCKRPRVLSVQTAGKSQSTRIAGRGVVHVPGMPKAERSQAPKGRRSWRAHVLRLRASKKDLGSSNARIRR